MIAELLQCAAATLTFCTPERDGRQAMPVSDWLRGGSSRVLAERFIDNHLALRYNASATVRHLPARHPVE
jgi:hypothetical protein